MRVTVLSSLAVLALLCSLQPCAAQDRQSETAGQAGKPAATPAKPKIGKARVGSLSPDEARRAARARERAAAALKPKTAPAEARRPAEVAAKPAAQIERQAAKLAPMKEPVRAAETRPALKPEVEPETAPVKTVETPASRPAEAPVTAANNSSTQAGRSASAHASKRATRTAEAKRKRLASRAERRRAAEAEPPPARYRFAGEPGMGERPAYVIAEGPRPIYEGRTVFMPRPMWRLVPPPRFAYPPYPGPYGYGYDD